jgi:hypothetical protein
LQKFKTHPTELKLFAQILDANQDVCFFSTFF